MIDLLVLGVLVGAGWSGWRRGTLRAALPLAGVVAGYAAAALLYRPLGRLVGTAAGLQPLIAYPLGGMLAFLLVNLAIRFPARKTARRLAEEQRKGERVLTPVDRAGGAMISSAAAAAVMIVLVWALAGVQLMTGSAARNPSFSERIAARTSRRVVQAAAQRLTGDRLFSTTMASLAADPAAGARDLQIVAGSEKLRAVFTDPDLHTALLSRNADAAAASPALTALADDRELNEAMNRLGLVQGASTEAVTRLVVNELGPLVRAVDELKRDPEVMRMMEGEHGLAARLQGGNAAALLNDPEFNALATRVLETMRREGARP